MAGVQGFGIRHVLNPNPYTGFFGNDGMRYAEDVRDVIQTATPGRVAGFISEAIQGVGGAVPLADGYLPAVYQVRQYSRYSEVHQIQWWYSRYSAGTRAQQRYSRYSGGTAGTGKGIADTAEVRGHSKGTAVTVEVQQALAKVYQVQ